MKVFQVILVITVAISLCNCKGELGGGGERGGAGGGGGGYGGGGGGGGFDPRQQSVKQVKIGKIIDK